MDSEEKYTLEELKYNALVVMRDSIKDGLHYDCLIYDDDDTRKEKEVIIKQLEKELSKKKYFPMKILTW